MTLSRRHFMLGSAGAVLATARTRPAWPMQSAGGGLAVFAYAVLRLADAGYLDLDRPLYDYLPIADANNSRMKWVTPRHVLSHTTGLPNWRQQLSPLEPLADPGKEFSYSGGGLLLPSEGGGGPEREAIRPLDAGAGAGPAGHEAEQLQLAA
ncbi:MAG: serine hydrolase domain-containing protein [Gemmatimonadales bacterium]